MNKEISEKKKVIFISFFLISFLLFGINDYINHNDVWVIMFLLRVSLVVPLFILLILLFIKKEKETKKIQLWENTSYFMTGSVIIFMVLLTDAFRFLTGALMILYFFGYLISGFDLKRSTTLNFLLFCLYIIVFLFFNTAIKIIDLWIIFFYFSGNLIGILGAYKIEREKKTTKENENFIKKQNDELITIFKNEREQKNKLEKEINENLALKKANEKLKMSLEKNAENNERFKLMLNVSDGGVGIHDQGLILDCSDKFSEITGYKKEELIGMNGISLISGNYKDKVLKKIKEGSESPYEVMGKRKNGEIYPLEIRATNIPWEGKTVRATQFFDLTKEKEEKRKQNDLEIKYENLFLNIPVGILNSHLEFKDDNFIFTVLNVNDKFEGFFGLKEKEIANMEFSDAFSRYDIPWHKIDKNKLKNKESFEIHFYSKTLKKHLKCLGYFSNKKNVTWLIEDVTEKTKLQEAKNYLLWFDPLVDLKNWSSFIHRSKNTTKKDLPISFLCFDINGLKQINDALGFSKGNSAIKFVSEKIKFYFKEQEIYYLTGGKFCVLLKQKKQKEAEKQANEFVSFFEKNNSLFVPIKLSFGTGILSSFDKNFLNVFSEAENNLNTSKLFDIQSHRSDFIKSILGILHSKNPAESEHSKRVSFYCSEIGKKINLSENERKELETVSYLHDIGKISIDKNILDKKEPLTDGEWENIKKHSETGYRLLSNSKEYSRFAKSVLHHHERFDGKGYPKGLKGEEIPLFSRIIMVADSYDAMISKRPYKRALSKKEATQELIKNKNKQFDAEIVDVFLEIIKKNN